VPDAAGLVHVVYNRDVPRKSVGTVGAVVQRARDLGDAVAAQVLERAAEELTIAAGSVASRLDMRGDEFPFVLAGGAFRAVPWLVDELGRRLIEVAPKCAVRLLSEEPAVGAVALAIADARGGARLPVYV
jgi:N-acetylglucosamine kinase-like BadF-type ATPase